MDIIVLCILSHSFHILQPLDVGCFGPLKAVYGKEIKKMMQMHLTHITKNNFFLTFKQAFFASMGEENIQTKFQATGLMPYDPKIMINNLDFRPRTPTPSNSHPTSTASTNPTTSKTAKDAIQNFIELKSKIVIH